MASTVLKVMMLQSSQIADTEVKMAGLADVLDVDWEGKRNQRCPWGFGSKPLSRGA